MLLTRLHNQFEDLVSKCVPLSQNHVAHTDCGFCKGPSYLLPAQPFLPKTLWVPWEKKKSFIDSALLHVLLQRIVYSYIL